MAGHRVPPGEKGFMERNVGFMLYRHSRKLNLAGRCTCVRNYMEVQTQSTPSWLVLFYLTQTHTHLISAIRYSMETERTERAVQLLNAADPWLESNEVSTLEPIK